MRRFGFVIGLLALSVVVVGCKHDRTPSNPKPPEPGKTDKTEKPVVEPKATPKPDPVKIEAELKKEKERLAKLAEELRLKEQALEDENKKKEAALKFKQHLASAVVLQAPPLGTGTLQDPTRPAADAFAEKLRQMAGRDPGTSLTSDELFRTTFSTKNVRTDPATKWTTGRNALVFPGKFDLASQTATWSGYFWYQYKPRRLFNEKILPDTRDQFMVQFAFPMNNTVAQSWSTAFQANSLEMTVWYKVEKSVRKQWAVFPDELGPNRLVHDVVLEAKVVSFESNVGRVKN